MTLFKSTFQRDTLFDDAGYLSSTLVQDAHDSDFSRANTDSSAAATEPTQTEQFIRLEEHEHALQTIEAEAYARGKQDAQAQFDAEFADQRQRFEALIQVLSGQVEDPAALFQPLKSLSLRLAELLVQGELNHSNHCIDQLITFTLEALKADPNQGINIELNPKDLALVGQHLREQDQVTWRENAELTRGSVRASWGDIAIENLFENRLHDLQQQLQLPQGQALPPIDSTQSSISAAPKLPDPIDPSAGPQPTTTFDENWP